jgi:hypothetical protein
MSWTCNSVAFDWLMPTINGLPASPSWQRAPRLVERNLLDTGDADIAQIGYGAWKIEGPIMVSSANYAAFAALNGTEVTVSDGTTSWTAVLSLSLSPLYETAQGGTGTATLTRARA